VLEAGLLVACRRDRERGLPGDSIGMLNAARS
jgi:hypothetical protein